MNLLDKIQSVPRGAHTNPQTLNEALDSCGDCQFWDSHRESFAVYDPGWCEKHETQMAMDGWCGKYEVSTR